MKKIFKYILNKILFIPKLLYGIVIFKFDVYKINKVLYTQNRNLFDENYIYTPYINYDPVDLKKIKRIIAKYETGKSNK